jgi:hypothetical protein
VHQKLSAFVRQNRQWAMIVNDAGRMVAQQWLGLVDRFANITLHEFIVMPNLYH